MPTTGERSNEGRRSCLIQVYPTGEGAGRCYMLGNEPATVGRDPVSEIRVNDKSVSRRHARVQPESDGYALQDLNSTNGTYVNEERVGMHRLRDGDYVHVGNAIFRYLSSSNVEAAYHEEIYRLTIIDALTGAHNQRYLREFLDRVMMRAARYNRPLTLIMFDIDHFKSINDRMGHLGGDYALRTLADLARGLARPEDLFARYGGEEFALVMPETANEFGVELAEELRRRVEQKQFMYDDTEFRMTMSFGVTTTEGEEELTPSDFIRRADEKLYEAKKLGRNRVVS
jgi:diguanylate cyclase (GGDEF)-like protein